MHPDNLYTAADITSNFKLGKARMAKLIAGGLKPARVTDADGKGTKTEWYRAGDVLDLITVVAPAK